MDSASISSAEISTFWAAISGAIVGGIIACAIQIIALKEARRQREKDHWRTQQLLGYSLIAKLTKIHSNFGTYYYHFHKQLRKKERNEELEPWQFVFPIANPPHPIHFSSDEMGMLIALKNDHVSTSVLLLDTAHNSMQDILSNFYNKRTMLIEQIEVQNIEGTRGTTTLHKSEYIALRPKMIEVNNIVEESYAYLKRGFEDSRGALHLVSELFRDELKIVYDIEKVVLSDPDGK